ncbi:glycine betaine ABC transporter substrate-binding protein [Alicyclobacillus mengziensis]|uniref:Glycine betaine ABC transporter substrate-binding protein n=1 Tax=Alicyclobacillus mengziensis TaxID=2931921 RepID=A0A9X7Z621_9BACL|nr:glycine betaine ABC transporter substrate-binding protein [Alicyclobacillus mengziensis]QSO45845.1 glycine betaine ABC transporter substrate-binding protein [Alicyclobacillus mengziensis]
MRKNKSVLLSLSIAAVSTILVAGCGTGSSGSLSTSGNASNTSSTTSSVPTTSGNKGTISIGYVDWAEDVADVYLWKDLLEQRGYKVNLHEMQAGPLWVGLAKGSIDVHFDDWLPTTDKVYMQKFGSKLVDLGKWYQGKTKLGLVVPDYVNINSISQLNANASEFNHEIVGIDAGAGETQIIENTVIPKYNLKLKLVNSSETAMLVSLSKAEKQHKPIVVVLWSPHWAFAKWHLKYLSDPKNTFGSSGWIQTEANKQWAQQNPTVAGWIRNFKLNQTQLGQLENDINTASSKQAGVQKWIKANQSLVNSWFK